MSAYNEENFELLSGYIIECRNNGHFMPYDDYGVLRTWLEESPNIETLIGIIDAVLPKRFAKAQELGKVSPSLKSFDKTVRKKIHEAAIFNAKHI